jgi:hypothetical protein
VVPGPRPNIAGGFAIGEFGINYNPASNAPKATGLPRPTGPHDSRCSAPAGHRASNDDAPC